MHDPVLEHMKAAAQTYLADIAARAQPYWLTLYGRNGYGNGTGKTFLARLLSAAARPLLRATIPTKWTHWPSLCERMQAREDTQHSFAFAESAGLLVLDDVGAEHQTAAMLSKLTRLMEARLRRWTIITTNLSPNDWKERDSRISSRLIRDGNRSVACETFDFALRQFNNTK